MHRSILPTPCSEPGGLLTIRSTDVPELDFASLAIAFERRVREACPEHLALARRLLERLPPRRWTLEWYLPWWLGRAFELDREVTREIVLSTILGLGSIRLQDDLADGDVGPEDFAAARTLSAALYEAALAPYRARFDPASPFWGQLDVWMQAWERATRDDDHLLLAERGAPLKVPAFAVCLLADRLDAFPVLERCLDLALEALVLFDHVGDWEADLDAGRWNAFVAALSSGPQAADRRRRHRSRVFAALLTTDAVDAYFARIEHGLLRAAAHAETLQPPVPSLVEHLREFSNGVRERGETVREHYHGLGDRAAELLVRAPVHAR